jgi:hypothetical protein
VAWTQELTFTPASYGLGDPYIYLRTSDYIASFNLSTGQFIAEVNLTTAKSATPSRSSLTVSHIHQGSRTTFDG